MKTPLALALAVLISSSITAEETTTLDGIVKKHAEARIADLNAWLKANPESDEKMVAIDHLLSSHADLGDTSAQIDLLGKKYDLLVAEEEPDIAVLINEVVGTKVTLLAESGKKDDARALLEKLKEDTKDHPMASRISQYADQRAGGLQKPSVGDSMDISFTSTEGKEIKIADMKGKVVLVDFWATWCGPCIREMPNVIKAYNEYHDKGFEVIGISLDQSKEKLDNYVKNNSMPWPQYFDGKGWKNDLAGEFGIRSIPATFLLGKDGKIIASNLRGSELDDKLAELLKD